MASITGIDRLLCPVGFSAVPVCDGLDLFWTRRYPSSGGQEVHTKSLSYVSVGFELGNSLTALVPPLSGYKLRLL